MMKVTCLLLLILAWVAVAQSASTPSYPVGSYFTVAQDPDGTWWFIDPNNKTFWSKGVDVWTFNSDPDRLTGSSPYKAAVTAKYGNLSVWADAQIERALRWGINTMGAWTHKSLWDLKIPYTVVLDFYSGWSSKFKAATGYTGVAPDLYDPGFKANSMNIIREKVVPFVTDPYLIGWYLDNEIHLGTNWWRQITLFAEYVNMSTTSYAWRATQTYLKKIYPTIKDMNDAWKTNLANHADFHMMALPANSNASRAAALFDQQTAKTYFDTVVPLLKAADPNHLVLGVKWNGQPNNLSLAVETSDVVSIDWYRDPRTTVWNEFKFANELTGRPLLVGEYCYRGNDTGHPNTRGGGSVQPTQAARATMFSNFIGNLSRVNFVIGAHWFRFMDEPFGGRYDGEDSNMGIVTEWDDEYTELANAMTKTHALVEQYHGSYTTLSGQTGPRFACPDSCSNHGYCHTATGRCICDKEYGGGNCAYLIGGVSDKFSNIDASIWSAANSGSASWYTRTYNDTTYATGTNGLTLTLNKNDTAACPGRYWAGPQIISRFDYQRGWLNFSYKASPYRQPRFQIVWHTYDKWNIEYGISISFNQTAVGLGQINKGPITYLSGYQFPYNISIDFHNYGIKWDLNDTISFYADGALVAQLDAPTGAQYGRTGFVGEILLNFYQSGSTCDYNSTSAYLKDFSYQVVTPTCPEDCNGKGACDYETGTCYCSDGSVGNDCAGSPTPVTTTTTAASTSASTTNAPDESFALKLSVNAYFALILVALMLI